ncbi:MAG: hypothetical protein PWP45_28 [Tepidanaerobacteraceae bacterium]|nr:hypothetical protein [Tepidanaerobacteraceae bacterium]
MSRFALLLCLYVWKESKGVGFLEYSEVYANYYVKVYRQLFYMLNDPFLAEDLAQEVFLKFYQNPPGKEGSAGAWLFRVAKNLAYNCLRGEDNRKKREIKFWLSKRDSEIFHLREEQIYVRQVLAKMDERDRMILIMKHSGYSYEEIAEVLGVNKTSIGTLVARARRKFKEYFKEEV